MKITDLFSPIQKGSSSLDSDQVVRLIQPVQPVAHVGKVTLVPGQILQGEVVGEDVNGLLLLKLAGEIIAARTPLKLEAGQQFWFEVKEAGAGESPLLNLASQKGAIQDLLKGIMATRPFLVKAQSLASIPAPSSPATESMPRFVDGLPGAGEGVKQAPSTPATTLAPTGGQPVPAAAVLAPDGSLPPEAARLIRALVVYMNQPRVAGLLQEENPLPQRPPELIKTMVSFIREGQLPAAFQKMAAFQGVIRTEVPMTVTPSPVVPNGGMHDTGTAGREFLQAAPAVEQLGTLSSPASASGITAPPPPGIFAPDTIKILNGLVGVAGIKAPVNGEEAGPLQPALNPERNLGEILTLIAREDKIPAPLLRLSSLQVLMGNISHAAPLRSGQIEPGPLSEKNEFASQELSAARAVLPLQFAAAQQGSEALPAQLRLLASLMGLGSQKHDIEAWQEIQKIFGRLSEAEMPAAAHKLASFFEAHSRVNAETPQAQSNFYIMPALFSGQTGWGEWLWSREGSAADNDGHFQESLVFFLEMSQLGALTIQVILKEKKLRGQILMEDKEGSELVAALLPGLRERLEAFGYDVVDFSCKCQALNVMQELKESLHRRAGLEPISLLDVQA
ncbi:MAG: hypothetical protein KKG53_00365 [Proteobacteria bacterium]|nr:hypothetical protein [Pseudomonadota bacterium]